MHTKPNEPQTYRGWSIHYARTTPTTGRWIATRQGVVLDAASELAIRRTVDHHIAGNVVHSL